MEGTILKGVGSFYTVRDDRGGEYVCKARGRFRKEGITPVPGDRVVFQYESEDGGRIESILPRKNQLRRPAVANIDKLLIVMALSAPQPDLLLADKLLLQCELMHIRPVLILNKCDEGEGEYAQRLIREYGGAGYSIFYASAVNHEGLETLQEEIKGCVCCFAGQSAVGKSSLLNCILPELHAQTGELSRKTDRGRHTTRHAQLWPVFDGAVLDTPGFSLLDTPDIEPQALSLYYPEMRPYADDCRFAECLHVSEPGCAVKAALEEGSIMRSRYERYLILLEELKEKRKHKYD